MAPRFHQYMLAALKALSAHADPFLCKPRAPFCSRSKSFNSGEKQDVIRSTRGSACAGRGQGLSGKFSEEQPSDLRANQKTSHLSTPEIGPYPFKIRICADPLPHGEPPDSSRVLPSSENCLHQFCPRRMWPMYASSRLPLDIHASMHKQSSGRGLMCSIYMQTCRPISSVLQQDQVNAVEDGEKQVKEPVAVVVLLGWLGAEHRHLKKYADLYTSRGIHAVTFTMPIQDIFTLKAEKHVETLSQKLLEWLSEDTSGQGQEKLVLVHTFSNTGWMTYGALLERLLQSTEGVELVKQIKGCVIDSGPSPSNDPRVWAAGLCAALFKKSSVATQKQLENAQPTPSMKETALITIFETLITGFLCIPHVKRRFDDVVSVLLTKQPCCPQLYLYSNADTVIPAVSVESFIAEQQKAGHFVRACNFQTSPHVDHLRSFPAKYREQLGTFLEYCLPQSEKASRSNGQDAKPCKSAEYIQVTAS